MTTSKNDTDFLSSSVAGIDISVGDPLRYSRVSTVYRDIKINSAKYPPLKAPDLNQCSTSCTSTATIVNQFNTLGLMGAKTSCNKHWIRNFDAKNGNNHNWTPDKLQNLSKISFRCLNWKPHTTNYSCTGFPAGSASCKVMQTSPSEFKAKRIFEILGRLELMGIPQIPIPSSQFYTSTSEGDLSCRSNPSSPGDGTYPNPFAVPPASTNSGASYQVIPGIFSAFTPGEFVDPSGGSNQFSAAFSQHFDPTNIKPIFKADEMVTCLPAGAKVELGSDPNLCCTGFIDETRAKCALSDFNDVSVYTNRYVSSAAADLPTGQIDTTTGYIKDPTITAQMACDQQICASGTMTLGFLVSKLITKGQDSQKEEDKLFRFLEKENKNTTDPDNANGILDLFNKGLKLNNHVYCIPKDSSLANATQGDVTVFKCGY
jgi:hypothetical protein